MVKCEHVLFQDKFEFSLPGNKEIIKTSYRTVSRLIRPKIEPETSRIKVRALPLESACSVHKIPNVTKCTEGKVVLNVCLYVWFPLHFFVS
jgi:hypothetical protein